ncbi:hypothetical protein Tco_1474656 [Tanacetum coccineum]
MTTLKFADTHNMVAFLSKPTESDGFEQIVDFLNAHPVKYALTVNPTIYTSCIEQFWSTVKIKTINGESQLHALVDGKKIIITEASVRRDLQLADENGIDCLPNSTIFEQLALMGYEKDSQKLTFYKPFFSLQWKFLIHTIIQCLSPKTTAWNEFSSTMAYAIICLATNQKFNFSKLIFKSMMKNLDNVSGKFLMYPRFVQVFLEQQLEDLSTHKRIYVAPTHTKKIFANMRRVGKELGEGSANPTDPHHTPTITQPSTSQPQKTQKPRKPKRKNTQVPQPSGSSKHVADEAVHKELGDSLVRAATTASSLEAEQDSGNITKTRSKATPNESSSLGTTSGGGPRCQETMGDTIAQTRFENVSKLSNDSLLARGNTLRSDEDSLKLKELMELCTNLQQRVLDLEKTKTTQQNEIASLKRRVKKLEQKKRSRTHGLKRLHKVGMSRRVVFSDNEESLGEDASKQGRIDADAEMFDVGTVTALKSVKSKVKGDVIEEPNVPVNAASASTKVSAATTTTATIPTPRKEIVITELGTPTITRSSQQPSQAEVQDKGKGKMIEEHVKPMKKKDLIRLDEEVALKLQAEFDEEERLAIDKVEQEKEANIALTEEWDDIQAKIEAHHELAQRLQAEEQEELFVEEKAKLFQQLLEQRRKHFAAKSAEEKRNKPPTQAQQRKTIAFKRVNTFVDFRTDLVEGSSKRAGEELEHESTKKQKVDEDKDTVELQSLMEVIPDKEEVAIDVVPLAIKSQKIVDWKIHKEGKISYYQIVRADGKSQMYMIFSQMLKSFDREDLEDLYKLVKAKYGSTRPVKSMYYLLWNDLKTMFEPHVEDAIWRNQQGYKVLEWKQRKSILKFK